MIGLSFYKIPNVFDRFERHLLFGKIYAQTVEDFTPSNCMYNKDTLKTGTARRLEHFSSPY